MKPKEVEKSTTLKVGMKHGPSNFIKYHLPSTTTTTTISEETHHTEKKPVSVVEGLFYLSCAKSVCVCGFFSSVVVGDFKSN